MTHSVVAVCNDTVWVTIRPIRPDDKARLSAGQRRLSPASAHARFLSPKPRFTSAELRYLTEVDGVDHVALALAEGDDIIGVGRFVRSAADPTSAEVAVVICDALQGRGLGTMLGLELAEAARARGIEHFTATMLPDNVPALRLLERITHHLHSELHDGVRELVADLDLAA
jgi:GNAT superfamily N-acetyltransferase